MIVLPLILRTPLWLVDVLATGIKKARHERHPCGHPHRFPRTTTKRSTHDELFLFVDLMTMPPRKAMV